MKTRSCILALLLRFPTGENALLYTGVPAVGAVMISAANIAAEKPMKLSFGEMKPYVAVYGALLFSTVLISGARALMNGMGNVSLNIFFAGAVLFALSDLVLSKEYFGKVKNRALATALNYLLYYGGQFAIACSLAFI